MIEAAFVTAAGDVVVRGGIVGRSAGTVVADGQIVAKFAAEAILRAGGDVKIGKQVMSSRIRTEGRLVAEQSAVIGGHIFAAAGADVATLGSESCTPTRLFAGIRPDVLAECAAIEERLHLPARPSNASARGSSR